MIVDSPRPETERWSRVARWTFIAIAVLLLPLMLRASLDFGVTWDEKARHKYGELIWEFLRGLRPRDEFLIEDGGNLYGGLFDTLCAAIEPYIPANRYAVRHALNATFGWAGIVYAGRLAAQLFGRWTGVLAMLLLVTSPRYFGEAMNNPKDLPFAAASVAALYYTSTIARAFPYISLSVGAGLALSLGIALNIRASALMYLGYAGLLVIGYAIAERQFTGRRLLDTTARLAALSLSVFLLGTLFWPWAQVSPIVRPIQALLGFANFPYGGSMLFRGELISSDAVPTSYVPWWFLISSPPVVIAGVGLALTLGARRWGSRLLLLAGVALLPIVLVIVMRSTLYDGVRHLLFVYPLFTILAAAGWMTALAVSRQPWIRGLTVAVLLAGIASAIHYEVRSYPNETSYFNRLVGGPRGALGRYDMDYWGNCLLEAVEWSAGVAQRAGRAATISGEPWQLIQLDSERFRQLMFTLPYRNEHQLDVRLLRGPAEGVQQLATRPDALYQVRTHDGAVLCVVIPGPLFWQLQRPAR